MSDEQCILVMAAIMRGSGIVQNSIEAAREMFTENKKLGPLPTQALPEIRKAKLSHPTVQDRNEAHAAREYDKRMGR